MTSPTESSSSNTCCPDKPLTTNRINLFLRSKSSKTLLLYPSVEHPS